MFFLVGRVPVDEYLDFRPFSSSQIAENARREERQVSPNRTITAAAEMVEKKTVLITGCSAGGLGFALAKAFEDEGFHVFATARDPAKAASLAGTGIEILPLDVASKESIDNCLSRVQQKTGGSLDVLVNNAGTALFGPLVHASIEEAKKVFDVHVFGMLAVAQAFVPLLVKARQGVMVNICSMAGAVPMAWQGR